MSIVKKIFNSIKDKIDIDFESNLEPDSIQGSFCIVNIQDYEIVSDGYSLVFDYYAVAPYTSDEGCRLNPPTDDVGDPEINIDILQILDNEERVVKITNTEKAQLQILIENQLC